MIPLGIMQSRLSPVDLKKGYQYWPSTWWDNEFKLAKLYGFSHIEWIYDDNPDNLLNTDIGVKEILEKIKQTGVNVDCICADYFIKHPFWAGHHGIKVLNKLIVQAFQLGARTIVLPLIEESSMFHDYQKREQFHANIKPCLDIAGRYLINICLETDLPPNQIQGMVETCLSKRLAICHDTGNVMAQGYHVGDSFNVYYNLVKHIHLKDKVRRKQENVEINTGDVNFTWLFNSMKDVRYDGTVTLQCARKEYDLEYIKKQFNAIKDLYARADSQRAMYP